MAETETWTPMVVVIPERIAEVLRRVTPQVFREADDEDRLLVENFCATNGWHPDSLAIGAWLAKLIDRHVSGGQP